MAKASLSKSFPVARGMRDALPTSLTTAKKIIVFSLAISMAATGCANQELDRLQRQADEARAAMIKGAIDPDPVTGLQAFLPDEKVTCTTFWGAFGEHHFVSDAKSCVEDRRYTGMEPLDKAAHDQRQTNEFTRWGIALQNQQRAAEAAQQAQRGEAARRKAGSLGNAQAGLRALEAGDSASAVRLFTEALDGGGLSEPDRELALVKRGQAYLSLGNNDLARADLQQALQLDPTDREAIGLLSQ